MSEFKHTEFGGSYIVSARVSSELLTDADVFQRLVAAGMERRLEEFKKTEVARMERELRGALDGPSPRGIILGS
jgi:hypothetical protein